MYPKGPNLLRDHLDNYLIHLGFHRHQHPDHIRHQEYLSRYPIEMDYIDLDNCHLHQEFHQNPSLLLATKYSMRLVGKSDNFDQ